MTENEISRIVVDAAYCIHKHFGPGLQETVYEVCLAHELSWKSNPWNTSIASIRSSSSRTCD